VTLLQLGSKARGCGRRDAVLTRCVAGSLIKSGIPAGQLWMNAT